MGNIERRRDPRKEIKWLLLFTICLMVILISGQECMAAGKDIDATIQIDELERTYHLHLPTDYSGKEMYPLVIVLHGGGGQGNNMPIYTGFSSLSDKENFIVVYPDGYKKLWAVGWGDSNAQGQKVDDVAFINQMINNLSSNYSIDQSRIYVTGMSMGGMLSHRLAIELGDRIAAIAPVSGTLPEKMASRMTNNKMPILMIHGTDDSIVPYEGGHIGLRQQSQISKIRTWNLSIRETIRYWAKNNGCQSEPIIEKILDQDTTDGTKVIISRYPAEDSINDIWMYTVEGGGHGWPRIALTETRENSGKLRDFFSKRMSSTWSGMEGTKINLGKVSHEFNASEIIWQFFRPLRRG